MVCATGGRTRRGPYDHARALVAWADATAGWVHGCAASQGSIDPGTPVGWGAHWVLTGRRLATHALLAWLWVTFCREVDGGTDWPKVRDSMAKVLQDIAFRIDLAQEAPDEETWGTSPAAVEAQDRLLAMGGAVDDGSPG